MSNEKRVRFELNGGGVAWVLPSDCRTILPWSPSSDVTLVRVSAGQFFDVLRVRMSPDDVQAHLSSAPAE